MILSTKYNHSSLKGFDRIKYELNKYHAERYWGIFVAGLLIWFWFLGYPWMPPVAFNGALQQPQNTHTVKVTAGQWYWMLEDGGHSQNANGTSNSTNNNQLYIKTGETVKFVARSIDVNHGLGVLSSSNQMDTPLFQMQVVPGYNNVFYYTFKKSETCIDVCQYTIRCLEYCGWNHPYMVSSITIHAV